MKKNNGFSLIEILIAASLLLTAVTTLVPIISLVQTERQVLSDRRTASLMVHDELQQFLWTTNTAIPSDYAKTINNKEIQLTFTNENGFVKGCGEWKNAKENHESFCLYGIPNQ